ncbi:glycosyl transferase family 1 [Porphyromonas gulae]|uniref:glycosyltransferase family 4 protein n=1 Tax=Porphyromonas gulae TaxID=111105 RepID=UPI00052BA732|nr:glycosyltransferase family 4 protein [Porphyromonas gulae]KGN76154.1 glycosyl transferase family 1 [Porphyromonas gulae]
MNKLIRITTIPLSLLKLLGGQLSYMKNSGFEILAVSSHGKELKEVANTEGVRVIPIDMSREITPFHDFISILKMCILFLKEKPLIVHTHTPKAGMVGMFAAWLCRIPIRLHTVAGMPILVHHGLKRKILEFVEKLTYSCATKVYPNSHEMKKNISSLRLAPEKKLEVLGNGSSNGIDTSFFCKTTLRNEEVAAIKHKIGGQFTFIFVGRIVRDKGIEELIEAFQLLHIKYPQCRLLLVGKEERDLNPISSKTIQIMKNNPAIFEAGWQTDVRPWLAASDALAFPSYREGFPNVVMQAGAMSLPSVVTDINGCNEIIIDGENGYIVPPRNTQALYEAMKKLLEDNSTTAIMAQKARSLIVNRYEQKAVWEAILSEYKKLIKLQQYK